MLGAFLLMTQKIKTLWTPVALALFAIVAVAGCRGGEGKPCQKDRDCSSGLICCPENRSFNERGTCETRCDPVIIRDGGTDAGLDAAADAG